LSFQPLVSQTLQALLWTEAGCEASDAVRVEVLPPASELYLPNAFTPNFDGRNDYWEVFPGPSVARITSIRIFSRWGDLVFASDGSPVRWNGTVAGQPAAAGVYTALVQYERIDGTRRQASVDVTVIR
jgi:gliding motility-associated-like protein